MRIDNSQPTPIRNESTFDFLLSRWQPFDPSRNFPDLGPRFAAGERIAREAVSSTRLPDGEEREHGEADKRDLNWATVLKRTFEAYVRGERPNMYGEWVQW